MVAAIMDSAYNYFLATYGRSGVSRYDAHKRSELRNTYNNIVKANKESPLYRIKESRDLDQFAIDIKEHAREIKNVIASLSPDGEGIEDAFQKKVAVSDQPDVVTAEYIGNGLESSDGADFAIEVKELASPQVNIGNFLRDDARDIEPGSYSFDLNTTTASYEFRFTVNPDDTNRSILEKLSKLFRTTNIDLTAEVVSDGNGRSALRTESKQAGRKGSKGDLFQISPDGSSSSIAAINALGINHVTTEARDASFLLNGVPHTSYSNAFTINNTFELRLKGISPDGKPAHIGYKTNADAVADNIQTLIDAYNRMVMTANKYLTSQQDGARLLSDIGGVATHYQDEFESLGLKVSENKAIAVDRALLTEAVSSPNRKESFSTLNHFKDSLYSKAEKVSVDPMNYVNKIMVAYKNPGRNFATPYITSLYSGMMLDSYC